MDINDQLRQSEESLAFALESGKMGTWDIDLKSNLVRCSPEMLRLWGYRPEEFNGDRALLQKKVHPEDLPRMVEAINVSIKKQSIYELEYRIYPTPDCMRWVMVRGRCTFDPKSELPVRFAGVVFDITDRIKKEEALAQATRARDQFFLIANHELKTPLTCLDLQLQITREELKLHYPEVYDDPMIKLSMKKQSDHLHRITRIVDNILDESTISHGRLELQREAFDLSEMVREMIGRYRIAAESAKVKIDAEITPGISGLWDRYRLEEVFLNLLMNAVKYGAQKPVKIRLEASPQEVRFSVADQGKGIDEEDQKHIFERYFRADSVGKVSGMGLGLFIANSIVIAHGGKISLRSIPNEGSEFTVILPRL